MGHAPHRTAPQAGKLLLEGCDVVVMDEAHELRNPTSETSKAMSLLRTRRRLALTGYPLQVCARRHAGRQELVHPAAAYGRTCIRHEPLCLQTSMHKHMCTCQMAHNRHRSVYICGGNVSWLTG